MSSSLLAAFGAGAVAAVTVGYLLRRRGPRPASTVDVVGCGTCNVTSIKSGASTLVSLDQSQVFGKMPSKMPFCSASIASDGTIYVSGTIGLAPVLPDAPKPPVIVKGGPRAEAVRTMQLVEAALKACGAGPEHIVMVHVYLSDNNKERFAEMNAGYLEYWGGRPLPARITVGCGGLALGAVVEIDVIAKM